MGKVGPRLLKARAFFTYRQLCKGLTCMVAGWKKVSHSTINIVIYMAKCEMAFWLFTVANQLGCHPRNRPRRRISFISAK
jgi:hypothetical protein